MSDRQTGTVKWFNNAKGFGTSRWPMCQMISLSTSAQFRVTAIVV